MSDTSAGESSGPAGPALVWYVGYGSNMSWERLSCYLRGGCPPGGSRHHPGARDPRPPRRSVAVELPGTVYFAGHSEQWGGGIAFYDHSTPGPSVGRAYLVSVPQLADIAAQEMHRVPEPGDPVEEVVLGGLLGGGLEGGRHHAGPGHYETLVEVGRLDGAPMLTFTAPYGVGHVPRTSPSAAYRAVLATGLRESHGWEERRVDRYLDGLLRVPADSLPFRHGVLRQG